MALARVVAFDGVTAERIEQLRSEMEAAEGPPEGLPATELLILHDPGAQRSLAIVFFENEDDYARGDATLDAMPTEGTPGRRVSIGRYDVAVRLTSQAATG